MSRVKLMGARLSIKGTTALWHPIKRVTVAPLHTTSVNVLTWSHSILDIRHVSPGQLREIFWRTQYNKARSVCWT